MKTKRTYKSSLEIGNEAISQFLSDNRLDETNISEWDDSTFNEYMSLLSKYGLGLDESPEAM